MPTHLALEKMWKEAQVPYATEIFEALELKSVLESILDETLFDRADDLS